MTIDYASVGSGAGRQEFTKRMVDFGATDIPMDARELAAFPGGASAVIQLPITLGGVVIAYNVPGLSDEYSPHRTHLHLSPDVVAHIFLGLINRWNDPDIAALNPSVKLPALPIAVVNRADVSGTTSIFREYLSDASPAWRARVVRGTAAVRLANSSVAVLSNEGVARRIMSSPGTIGYVALAYALATKMNYAALRNRSGAFVLPSMMSVQAAAAQHPVISTTDFAIDDLGGPASYPITGYSWLLLERNMNAAGKGAALCSFARWMLTDGQQVAPSVGYVALPANVSRAALAALGPCS